MIKDFTLYSEPIKKILQQLELEQKEKDSVDYEKISPCTQLVKDEFKEILKLSKKISSGNLSAIMTCNFST